MLPDPSVPSCVCPRSKARSDTSPASAPGRQPPFLDAVELLRRPKPCFTAHAAPARARAQIAPGQLEIAPGAADTRRHVPVHLRDDLAQPGLDVRSAQT